MGYYTLYSLQVHPYSVLQKKVLPGEVSGELCTEIEAEIDKMDVLWVGNAGDGFYGEAKGYEYERDMCLLSLKIPDVLFVLHGDGEDPDDRWDAYFQGGKMQHCPAVITYDSFSPDRLQELSDPVQLQEKYFYQDDDDE